MDLLSTLVSERDDLLEGIENQDRETPSGFEDLIHWASDICQTPHIVISFFDEHMGRINAETGFRVAQSPLNEALRKYVVSNSEPLVIRDLSVDPRFQNLPTSDGLPAFRFYAGVGLVVDEEIVGTFGVLDTRPRNLSLRQTQSISFLAKQTALRIELHRREHQRAAAEARLEQHKNNTMAFFKLSALGEMASGIAHEINNPLAAIMSRAEQLIDISEQERDPRQQTKMIGQQIEKICLRIARTVNSVKNFARDEELEPMTKVSVSTLVETTLDICREKFKGDVSLDVSISDALLSKNMPTVSCHPIQISQVLLNLLSNAHYAAAQSEEKWVRIEIKNQIDDVEFSVTDSGAGIPAELRAKIMQPFFTTKPIGQGTGIGLSISGKIMQDHGSTLELDETSKTTRFVFRLKKSEASPTATS